MRREDNSGVNEENEYLADDDSFVEGFDELDDDDIAHPSGDAYGAGDEDRHAGSMRSMDDDEVVPKKKNSLFGRKKKRTLQKKQAPDRGPAGTRKKKTGIVGKIMWATIVLSLVATGAFVGIIFLGGAGSGDVAPPELNVNGRNYDAARQQASGSQPAPPENKWLSVDEKREVSARRPDEIRQAPPKPPEPSERVARQAEGSATSPEVLPGIDNEISRQERELSETQTRLAHQNNSRDDLHEMVEQVRRQYDQQQQKIDQLISLVEKGVLSGQTPQTGSGDSRVIADSEMKSELVSALDAKKSLSAKLARLEKELEKSRNQIAALERKNRNLISDLSRNKQLLADAKEDNRMLKMANHDLIAQLEDMQNNNKGIWAGWELVGMSKNMIVLRLNNEVKTVRLYDSFAGVTVQKIDVDNHVVKTSAGSIRVEG